VAGWLAAQSWQVVPDFLLLACCYQDFSLTDVIDEAHLFYVDRRRQAFTFFG
jgi:hypothetical protein